MLLNCERYVKYVLIEVVVIWSLIILIVILFGVVFFSNWLEFRLWIILL